MFKRAREVLLAGVAVWTVMSAAAARQPDITVIARSAGPAPGGPAGAVFTPTFSEAQINNLGTVAFMAGITGPHTSNTAGIWTLAGPVALQGDRPAPTVSPIQSFQGLALSADDALIAIGAATLGAQPILLESRAGVLSVLARTGDHVPGGGDGLSWSSSRSYGAWGPRIAATLLTTGGPVSSFNARLAVNDGASLRTIIAGGDPAPGFTTGWRYGELPFAAANAFGTYAVRGNAKTTSGGSVIAMWRGNDAGNFDLLARGVGASGGSSPAFGLTEIANPWVGRDGSVTFIGVVSTGPNVFRAMPGEPARVLIDGTFVPRGSGEAIRRSRLMDLRVSRSGERIALMLSLLNTSGQPLATAIAVGTGADAAVVAMTGQRAPGLPDGATFGSFDVPWDVNDRGQVVFSGMYLLNGARRSALWATDGSGHVHLLAAVDRPLAVEGAPAGNVTLVRYSVPQNEGPAGASGINDLGHAVFAATISGDWMVLCDADLSRGCPADFNNDGAVDGADVEAFFDAWTIADSHADINADGGIDGSDVQYFIARWEGGC